MNKQDIIGRIEIALIDGKLDDAERNVLYQTAVASGISSAELDALIESRRLALNASGQIRSAVQKCPSCLELIDKEMMTTCKRCGASLASTLSSKKVDEFHSSLMKLSTERRHELIKSYPLPTEKNEIVAFLSLSTPLAIEAFTFIPAVSFLVGQDERHRIDEQNAWLTKTQALISNSKVIYAGDSSMHQILDTYELQLVRKRKDINKYRVLTSVSLLLVLLVANFKAHRFEHDIFYGLRKTTIGVLKMASIAIPIIVASYIGIKRLSNRSR